MKTHKMRTNEMLGIIKHAKELRKLHSKSLTASYGNDNGKYSRPHKRKLECLRYSNTNKRQCLNDIENLKPSDEFKAGEPSVLIDPMNFENVNIRPEDNTFGVGQKCHKRKREEDPNSKKKCHKRKREEDPNSKNIGPNTKQIRITPNKKMNYCIKSQKAQRPKCYFKTVKDLKNIFKLNRISPEEISNIFQQTAKKISLLFKFIHDDSVKCIPGTELTDPHIFGVKFKKKFTYFIYIFMCNTLFPTPDQYKIDLNYYTKILKEVIHSNNIQWVSRKSRISSSFDTIACLNGFVERNMDKYDIDTVAENYLPLTTKCARIKQKCILHEMEMEDKSSIEIRTIPCRLVFRKFIQLIINKNTKNIFKNVEKTKYSNHSEKTEDSEMVLEKEKEKPNEENISTKTNEPDIIDCSRDVENTTEDTGNNETVIEDPDIFNGSLKKQYKKTSYPPISVSVFGTVLKIIIKNITHGIFEGTQEIIDSNESVNEKDDINIIEAMKNDPDKFLLKCLDYFRFDFSIVDPTGSTIILFKDKKKNKHKTMKLDDRVDKNDLNRKIFGNFYIPMDQPYKTTLHLFFELKNFNENTNIYELIQMAISDQQLKSLKSDDATLSTIIDFSLRTIATRLQDLLFGGKIKRELLTDGIRSLVIPFNNERICFSHIYELLKINRPTYSIEKGTVQDWSLIQNTWLAYKNGNFEKTKTGLKPITSGLDDVEKLTEDTNIKINEHNFEKTKTGLKPITLGLDDVEKLIEDTNIKINEHNFEKTETGLKPITSGLDDVEKFTEDTNIKINEHNFEKTETGLKPITSELDEVEIIENLEQLVEDYNIKINEHTIRVADESDIAFVDLTIDSEDVNVENTVDIPNFQFEQNELEVAPMETPSTSSNCVSDFTNDISTVNEFDELHNIKINGFVPTFDDCANYNIDDGFIHCNMQNTIKEDRFDNNMYANNIYGNDESEIIVVRCPVSGSPYHHSNDDLINSSSDYTQYIQEDPTFNEIPMDTYDVTTNISPQNLNQMMDVDQYLKEDIPQENSLLLSESDILGYYPDEIIPSLGDDIYIDMPTGFDNAGILSSP